MKIEHTNDVADLDIKRCYLPIVITDTCPHCGLTVQKFLSGDYVSYPKLNKPFDVSMHHIIEHDEGMRDEEHDWKVKVILRVTMEAVEQCLHYPDGKLPPHVSACACRVCQPGPGACGCFSCKPARKP